MTDDARTTDAQANDLQPYTMSTGKACRQLGVTRGTLWRYGNAGLIGYRSTPGGHRRYRPEDVANLLRGPDDSAAPATAAR